MTATEGLKTYLKNEFASKRAELGISQEQITVQHNTSQQSASITGLNQQPHCIQKAI